MRPYDPTVRVGTRDVVSSQSSVVPNAGRRTADTAQTRLRKTAMADSPERRSQFRWLYGAIGAIVVIGAMVLVGLGIIGYGSSTRAADVWMIVAGCFLFFVAIVLLSLMPTILRLEALLEREVGVLRGLGETMAHQTEVLQAVAENTRLSDAAKSLAHREQELDSLRSAIRDDLRTSQWEAATTLIDEMERRFGHKDEADHFREELDDARNETIEAKLAEAIEMVESHFQSYDWVRAQGEIDRLRHALPDHAKIDALDERMKLLKEEHKQALLREWDEAVRRSDTDHGIDVLKEIDQYLSSAEAKALQVSARNVFKEKLLQLGVQFRFAVVERRWQDALTAGLELIRDFPNSRMANEVREALDTLRARARSTSGSDAKVPEATP